MSEDCNNTRHPLLRDGTSQQQRLLKALLPSYVSVDERSMDDLIAFAKKYAEEIHFYDQDNLTNGNWVEFFQHAVDAQNQETEPHYALFIAFLDLFRVAQDDLNTITQRHLDFYYREVLQLKEKPAVPDQVYVIFQLAKQVATGLEKEGTLLNAGKDATGVNLSYATDENIVVNKGAIRELKAVFAEKTPQHRIYGSPVANSSDGIGGELTGDELKWRTFGRNQPVGLPDRPQGEVGFAFASPILFMEEGKRTVTIKLTFAPAPSGLTAAMLANAFRMQLSGEEEWLTPEDPANVVLVSGNQITIERTLTEAQPPVVAYDAENLGQLFQTSWPVVKIVLNNDPAVSFAYNSLKGLTLSGAEIKVNVRGVKNLTLFNDDAKLKADKPFLPFTSRPLIGSTLYIGSTEVFSKKIDSLGIDLTWHGLPFAPNGFWNHYHNYIPAVDNLNRTNAGFKANISLLDGKKWNYISTERLFAEQNSVTLAVEDIEIQTRGLEPFVGIVGPNSQALPPAPIILMAIPTFRLSELKHISISGNSTLSSIPRDASMAPAKAIDSTTFKGFVKLELTGADFGHKDYPLSVTQQVVQAVIDETVPAIVNEPYTPTVKEIALNYTSSVSISFPNDETAFNDRIEQFYHVQPFGVCEMHPFTFVPSTSSLNLLPQFNDEGNLYIGVSGLKPAQVLNVLFKVADGSANPDLNTQPVKWSYMVRNQWVEFPTLKVLADGTKGLLNSGIVIFDVPSEATSDNTVLTPGLHWIRASVENESGAVCDLINLHAQAVTATFADKGNDPEHLRQALPAETIAKLRESDARFSSVTQPYASFGGKVKEQSNDFYLRVSERLRHKHRAVTIWDYEHLVLEKFPSVYKVKCISHTEDNQLNYSELAPGHVTLIAVSNLRNKNLVNPLQPKTSLGTLQDIKDYISTLTSWWVGLDVRNPLFDEVRVTFNVRFLPGFDNGFYGSQLQDDIKKFLSPWAYEGGKDLSFGGRVHRSVILNFVEELEYVDFVTCFRMDMITSGNVVLPNIEEAIPVNAASVLVSATTHFITVLETEDCECNENTVVVDQLRPADDVSCDVRGIQPPEDGIGSETIGDDFIVGDPPQSGINFFQIENDFTID